MHDLAYIVERNKRATNEYPAHRKREKRNDRAKAARLAHYSK